MNGNWTDILQIETNKRHHGCVLCFKTHHVKSKRSRKKCGPFLLATAICKGNDCCGKFKFVIEEEPTPESISVKLNYTVSGDIRHSKEEINRRNISGKQREMLGLDIQTKSASKVYYEQVLSGNTAQLSVGNYTNVPNQTVLRKMVSEILKKEQLHSNILAELQVLKESYDKSSEPYIREIGYDPFYLIMFSDRQMQMLRNLSAEDDLYIYLDATGSVISNIVGQKRPYLYSFVVKPNAELPSVSLADMISTQHTIPRIELFLSLIKRSANIAGKVLRIKKVETDYSLALIQACLHTFNNMNIKTYLQSCMDIMKTKTVPSDFTVHHLCAAHMIRDFSRQLTKYKPKTKSKLRKFILQCFAALQNTTSLQETKEVYSRICTVLSNSKMSTEVNAAVKELKEQFQTTEVWDDEDTSIFGDDGNCNTENVEEKTIKAASPFTEIFEQITMGIQTSKSGMENEEDNILYCPEAVQCLLDKFMPIVSMWSGIMLNICSLTTDKQREDCIISRDTNSPAENWFKYIKTDLKTPRHARPYVFVTSLRQACESRLKEHLFPGCRKKKTKSKKKTESDANLSTKEEVWKPNRKKGVYHTTPKTKRLTKKSLSKDITAPRFLHPKVMKWGGKVGKTVLANTCTIDNVLTILHLRYACDEHFKSFIGNDGHLLSQTLLTVFKLMSEEQFSAAKLIWVDYTGKLIKPTMNLYGDEYDFIVTYVDGQWMSMTVSTCDNPSCEEPMKESPEHRGIVVGLSKPFRCIQYLIDKWLKDTKTCAEERYGIDVSMITKEHMCPGIRTIKRRVLHHPPILVVRVYEHCLFDRLSLKRILERTDITLNEYLYCLAGLTLHKSEHYTAIVSTSCGPLWYDGLIGELGQIPRDVDTWFPCHVFFVRQH